MPMLEILTPESSRWDEFADALLQTIGSPPIHCDGDAGPNVHRHAKQIMAKMGGVDIPKSLAFFESRGGYCDCEILLNVDDWSAIERAESAARDSAAVSFPIAPGAWKDPDVPPEIAKLWQEHEAEAHRNSAKFYNYGKITTDDSIYSKTSAGHLDSRISRSGQIEHEWNKGR